jgi:hypothetical protein
MTIFILSFILMIFFVLALSLSILFGRPAMKRSCRAVDDIPGFDAEDACSGACGNKRITGDGRQGHVCRRLGR